MKALVRTRQLRARVRMKCGTVRGQILIAFLAMSVITGTFGVYTAIGIRGAGVLVTKTFDQSLMSINYARAAQADFASMQALIARLGFVDDPQMQLELKRKVQELERSLSDDLAIAAERSQSQRAANAAENVRRAVVAWSDAHRRLLDGHEPNAIWGELDTYAKTADQQIDLLINYTAGDGFTYRQSARATVALDTQLNLLAAVLAMVLSGLVTWLLGRRIMGPLAAASAVAKRIARGDLEGAIPRGNGDELGALLISMGVMRDNIKAMMAREVEQRRSAQALLADALANSREGVLAIDAEGRIALANAQAADFLGSSPERLKGSAFADYAILTDGLTKNLTSSHNDDSLYATGETTLPDGRCLRVSRSATQEGGFIVVCSDISAMKEQKEKLAATNLRLDAALDNMSQGLCFYDSENRLKVVNRRFCEIFNLAPESVQPGIMFQNVLELSVEAGNHPQKTVAELAGEQAASIGSTHFQELSEGRVVAIAHQPTVDGGWVATYEDVTERRQAEARIVFMARHDALTRLPNRVQLAEQIDQAVAQLGRGAGFAVLCLDLDDFKKINDTLGHPVGDEVLRMVGERLQACVREVDTVARLGGDEFAILQSELQQPEQVIVLARRIVEVVSAPYEIGAHRLILGVSIGIAVAPGDGSSCGTLLKNADVALYRAKADGRGTWRFFEAEMDARLQARRKLELDLREALANNELELYYQPLYNLKQERVSGFEALMRWQNPARGMVMPAEFIHVAEEMGLIVPMGEWALHRACADASNWPWDVKVAVNVSPVQFKDGRLVQIVSEALAASGLAPERLELEITESVLLASGTTTLATLHALRKLGVRIAMDDFGTGYSSLSYLRSFPFDKIKIDQSFIRDLGATDRSGLIVSSVIGLCSSMGMTTTAEGVETEEQLARLRLEKCDEAQGYLFSRPVPQLEIPGLITRLDRSPRELIAAEKDGAKRNVVSYRSRR
jgi:diguanylate cyclase (GGDEF)-like protein